MPLCPCDMRYFMRCRGLDLLVSLCILLFAGCMWLGYELSEKHAEKVQLQKLYDRLEARHAESEQIITKQALFIKMRLGR